MVNFKYIGLPILLGLFGTVSAAGCDFTITDTGCTADAACSTNYGFYLKENKLIHYTSDETTPCEVIAFPTPGYYKNKGKTDDNDEFIQCTSTGCSTIKKEASACAAGNDGKIVTSGNLCTKMNELNLGGAQPALENTKYIEIDFDTSNNNYIVHHAGDVFNFNGDHFNTYYVVKKDRDYIVFDPSFIGGNTAGEEGQYNVEDYCATKDGLMMDRKTDFCSNASSGMYYSCVYGKCTSESQLDSTQKEDNGNTECHCHQGSVGTVATGCTKKGYYLEGSDLYEFSSGTTCTQKAANSLAKGFYWNEYTYNSALKNDGESFTHVNVVLNSSCEGHANEIIDNGFTLLFCDSEGKAIAVSSLADNSHTVVQGVASTLFTDTSKYYLLKKGANSLALDTEATGEKTVGDQKYNCENGVCTKVTPAAVTCDPTSTTAAERADCSGYYLNGNDLLKCTGTGDAVTCQSTAISLGYYKAGPKAADAAKYIKCTADSSGAKKCEGLSAPAESATTCGAAGALIYGGSAGKVKLCTDIEASHAFEIFKDEDKLYLLKASVLNGATAVADQFYAVDVHSADTVLTKDLTDASHFIYTYGQEILPDTTTCTAEQRATLVEYERVDGGLYKKEESEAPAAPEGDSRKRRREL